MDPVESPRACVLEFQIACDLSQVRLAAERARVFLTEKHWAPSGIIDAELALVEACNNAVQYARGAGRELPVSIRLALHNGELEMEVVDHTPGFEWPSKAALPDAEAESGRGIFLIQETMDQTQYVRRQGENTLIMKMSSNKARGK